MWNYIDTVPSSVSFGRSGFWRSRGGLIVLRERHDTVEVAKKIVVKVPDVRHGLLG